MIKVILSGGLGNQIFQYAAGRALALKHSTNLVVNLSLLKRTDASIASRGYELEKFNVVADIEFSAPFPGWRVVEKLPRFLCSVNPWRFYKERKSSYDPGLLQLPDGAVLYGYWQSHIYFSEISKQLVSELQHIRPLGEKSIIVLDKIRSSNSIAIHIRRGDYVDNPKASSFHGLMSLEYYKEAVSHALAKFPDATFFIFSDDPSWCKKNLKLERVCFVDHNSGDNSWEDLILMSKCTHHIIANSSFSWWAAWIADNCLEADNHLVIAPKNWFKKVQEINIGDRFPLHWVLL